MTSIFITGSNRGLGFEFAKQYAADGWRVYATCRTPDRADALKKLEGDVRIHKLDVADFDEVDALADELRDETFDVVLLNAGLAMEPDETGKRKGSSLGVLDYDAWMEVFRVNTMAPAKIVESFLDQILRSERKLVIGISSTLGSMAHTYPEEYAYKLRGPAYLYRSTKAALNSVIKTIASELESEGITAIAMNPGWIRTDMGGPTAYMDAPEAIASMRQVIAGLGPADNGRFIEYDGSPLPW